MKHATRSFLLLFLIALVATYCGPVTAVPTRSPTSESTAQPTFTVTPEIHIKEPSSTLSTQLWKNDPPSKLVDQYELVSWTPDFYKTITNLLDRIDVDYYWYLGTQSDRFRAAFASEAWLRTGAAMDNNPMLCAVNYYDPATRQFPKLRPGQDLFSFFVENLIHNRGIAVESLPESISSLIGTPDCLGGFSLEGTGNIYFEPNTVHNLFGDGQDSYVFAVGSLFSSDSQIAVYATHSVDGTVHVEQVRSWESYFPFASTYDFHVVDIGDLNGNGQNEFVLRVEFSASGIPGWSSEWVYLYEWDAKTSSFKASDEITIFAQECDRGPCSGDWQFSSSSASSLQLTTQEYLYTNAVSECELLTREKSYTVGPDSFVLLSDAYLMPAVSSPLCQISWAYQVLIQPGGWKNDKAIEIVSNALTDWPQELDEFWGPESKEYFQLMLGLWEDLRGESERALSRLERVKTLQHNSKPTFLAQLAQAYLISRDRDGMVVACSKMNTLQRELLLDKDILAAKALMGFWHAGWVLFADDFCDGDAALAAWFSMQDPTNILKEESLRDWLARQGKEDIYVRTVKVDNREVWLASFLTDTIREHNIAVYQLWGFSDKLGKRNAVFLGEMWLDQKRSNVAHSYNEHSVIMEILERPQAVPILLVEFDDCLSFLDANSDEIKVLKEICALELDFYIDGEHIQIMTSETYPHSWEFHTYAWNALTGNLDEVPLQEFDFDSVQNKAESLVYVKNNYAGAIVHINRALLSSPPDRVTWPACHEYLASRADELETQPIISLCEQPMEWHRPYLLYLLALSYEMDGRSEDAKLTYYSLWNDHPDSVFGVAASLRLAPTNP